MRSACHTVQPRLCCSPLLRPSLYCSSCSWLDVDDCAVGVADSIGHGKSSSCCRKSAEVSVKISLYQRCHVRRWLPRCFPAVVLPRTRTFALCKNAVVR